MIISGKIKNSNLVWNVIIGRLCNCEKIKRIHGLRKLSRKEKKRGKSDNGWRLSTVVYKIKTPLYKQHDYQFLY